MNAIQFEVQEDGIAAAAVASEALELRTLESAEMIHVGGGYCAADY